jgi:hypothetical protein
MFSPFISVILPHIEYYVETILDKSRGRQTLASANALVAATEYPSVSTDECLQRIMQAPLKIEATSGRHTKPCERAHA